MYYIPNVNPQTRTSVLPRAHQSPQPVLALRVLAGMCVSQRAEQGTPEALGGHEAAGPARPPRGPPPCRGSVGKKWAAPHRGRYRRSVPPRRR